MSPTFLGNKPFPPGAKRRLVAQYGLTDADSMLSGRADECMYELIAHIDAGREVVESRDEQRHVWVYKVYELEDEVYGPLASSDSQHPPLGSREGSVGILAHLVRAERERERNGVRTVPLPPLSTARRAGVLERRESGGDDT